MAAANFERALALVLKAEGGFVDDPRDPGGATNFGVTLATLARTRGRPVSKAEVAALNRTEVADIYRRLYWTAVAADDLPAGLDLALFDLAVNSGPNRAMRLLQRALLVPEDGMPGPVTLRAAQGANPAEIVRALTSERLGFLRRLGTWAVFGRGWRRRVAMVEREALALAGAASIPPAISPASTSKGPVMIDTKSILASRTVWANLVGLAALGLGFFGLDTKGIDVNGVAEAAAQIVAAGSFIVSTAFRVMATKRLGA